MKKLDKKLETSEVIKVESNRRKFLKKAAYSAPVLLALGQLAKPTKAQADSGGPSGPPGGGGWGGFG
ncbi:hypothetical protein C9926_03200 [Sulfurovum lithotrophicum]|nr:hypothetical protein C9926_03200 [Sulfurovum lithotrophicum]